MVDIGKAPRYINSMKGLSIIFLIPLIAAGFSGCELFAPNDYFYFDEKAFHAEWDKWNAQGLEDYSYIITGYMMPYRHDENARALLMYAYEAKVIVKGGAFDSYEYVNSHDPNFIDTPELFEDYRIEFLTFTSISQMYQSIYDWAEEKQANIQEIKDSPGMRAFRFSLRYDYDLHYPSYFYPMIESEPGWIWDTTLHAVSISALTPL